MVKIAERYKQVLDYFIVNKPIAETELYYENPFQLLVAVILSAQCTDKRVNMVTPNLFIEFPNPQKMAEAELEDVFKIIKSISYPNNKAKHLLGMAQMLLNDFNGQVPEKIEDLVKLPGVGRKTANVISSVIYHQPAMAVDTHVFRVSARLGLTKGAKTPLAAEKQLVKHIPQAYIATAHHWLILHGRYTCTARNPKCEECGLREICKEYATIEKMKRA
jgi:endonuclease-3